MSCILTQEELPNASRCTSVAKRNCEARVRGWKTHMVSLYLHIWLTTSRKQTGWEAIEGTVSPNLALWVYEARLRLEPPCKGPRQVLEVLGRCARLLGKFLGPREADSLLCGDVTDNVRPLRSFSRLHLAGMTGTAFAWRLSRALHRLMLHSKNINLFLYPVVFKLLIQVAFILITFAVVSTFIIILKSIFQHLFFQMYFYFECKCILKYFFKCIFWNIFQK